MIFSFFFIIEVFSNINYKIDKLEISIFNKNQLVF
jgi:hypothetical protein